MRCIQSEVMQWRLLFIFTASAHLISAVCFVLLGASRHQSIDNSTPLVSPLPSMSSASPTTCEVPLIAKPVVVRQTSSGRRRQSSRSSGRPSGGSLSTDRELHLVQLMESAMYEGKDQSDLARSCMQCTRDVLYIAIRMNALGGQRC